MLVPSHAFESLTRFSAGEADLELSVGGAKYVGRFRASVSAFESTHTHNLHADPNENTSSAGNR